MRERRRSRRLEVHDRNTVHDRKRAAVTAEYAVEDLITVAVDEARFDERETSAAKRAPEEIEEIGTHGSAREV
jgi:hypothetical protein